MKDDKARKNTTDVGDQFERESQQSQTGLVAEFFSYLRHNRKWWLAPIVFALLLLAGLVWLGGTAAAPFIYTLF
ncbi:MAG: hypothetical protein JKY86_04150 [Gammaproteobacteria bacterium]|nr:hypothetical protein [Gammaproteobacteria bacterium]